MPELTCYEFIKDGLTILTPIAIAIYVYRLTTGDAKREARISALYKLHESINSVRYQHSVHEIILEKQAQYSASGNQYVSNDEFAQRVVNLELARAKLGADFMLVKSAFHSEKTAALEKVVNDILLSRSQRLSSDDVSKLSDKALSTAQGFVQELT